MRNNHGKYIYDSAGLPGTANTGSGGGGGGGGGVGGENGVGGVGGSGIVIIRYKAPRKAGIIIM